MKAATSGEWKRVPVIEYCGITIQNENWNTLDGPEQALFDAIYSEKTVVSRKPRYIAYEDARYIAHFSPDKIAKMLAVIEGVKELKHKRKTVCIGWASSELKLYELLKEYEGQSDE